MKNKILIFSLILISSIFIFLISAPKAMACSGDGECPDNRACRGGSCVTCASLGIWCGGTVESCANTGACTCAACFYDCYACAGHCAGEDCSRVNPGPGSIRCSFGLGGAADCDGISPGDACGAAGGTCDNNCQCVAPVCGDGTCNGTETPASCPADCTAAPVCGDGTCNGTETAASCPADCSVPGVCSSGPSYTCPAGCSCSSVGQCEGGLVPCGRTCDDPCTATCECCPCTLCHLFVLLKRIIDFFTLYILLPIGVLMIIVGGGSLLTSAGNPGRISSGKKILTSAIIGVVIVVLSWVIINTVIVFATTGHIPAPGEIGKILTYKWNEIDCPVSEETIACPNGGSARGASCTEDSGCCSGECAEGLDVCYDSSLALPEFSSCYVGEECLSGVCVGPTPGTCD